MLRRKEKRNYFQVEEKGDSTSIKNNPTTRPKGKRGVVKGSPRCERKKGRRDVPPSRYL